MSFWPNRRWDNWNALSHQNDILDIYMWFNTFRFAVQPTQQGLYTSLYTPMCMLLCGWPCKAAVSKFGYDITSKKGNSPGSCSAWQCFVDMPCTARCCCRHIDKLLSCCIIEFGATHKYNHSTLWVAKLAVSYSQKSCVWMTSTRLQCTQLKRQDIIYIRYIVWMGVSGGVYSEGVYIVLFDNSVAMVIEVATTVRHVCAV